MRAIPWKSHKVKDEKQIEERSDKEEEKAM